MINTEIKKTFYNYINKKWYKNRKAETLLSDIFKTTFTISWWPDLAYKFAQWDKSLVWNHVVLQPCIRHWDIEAVWDTKHLSYFNMFVCDWIEWKSRKEILSDFYYFFTEILNLDKDKIFASYFNWAEIKWKIFEADIEAKQIWLDLWIKDENIIAFDWENWREAFVANTVEPVGWPRTELFYDLRENKTKVTSQEEFLNQDNKWKILEFFTHVLYNIEVIAKKVENKNDHIFSFKDLEITAKAAWFWPERLQFILQNQTDISKIWEFDEYYKLYSGENKKSFYIFFEHLRGIILLIRDWILKISKNENRSKRYLYKKYLKNLKVNLKKLNLDKKDENNLISDLIIKIVLNFNEFYWDKIESENMKKIIFEEIEKIKL